MKQNKNLLKLVYSAMFLALCLVLPFLTGQIPTIGKALSPMHIPVMLCGFLVGAPWAAAVGFIAPLLRGVLFGMPALMPGGLSMAFELATYGIVTGLLYRIFPKKIGWIYVELLIAMVCGRVIWGIARFIIAGVTAGEFTFAAFMAGALTNAIPGIILHLILIPGLVMALRKAGVGLNEEK